MRAANLIEETTIVEFAKKREQEILEGAEQQRAMLIAGAVQYADRILEDAEQTVNSTLEALSAGVAVLQKQAKEEMDVSLRELKDARTALKSAEENV